MNHSIFIGVFIVFALLLYSSCKKQDEEVVMQDTCVAGSSGNLTIKVTLRHHDHTIINLKNYRDTIYVKYNAQEFPGSSPAAYDTTYIGEYPENFVMLTNLKCGKYFLFAVGMESTHYDRVSAGIPFSTEQKEGEVSITIPVTE